MASSKFSSSSGTPFSFFRIPKGTWNNDWSEVSSTYTAKSLNLWGTTTQSSTHTFPYELSEGFFLLVIFWQLTVVLQRKMQSDILWCTDPSRVQIKVEYFSDILAQKMYLTEPFLHVLSDNNNPRRVTVILQTKNRIIKWNDQVCKAEIGGHTTVLKPKHTFLSMLSRS